MTMVWRGLTGLQKKFMQAGAISPRAWRKQMSERGLVDAGYINGGGRGKKWPAVSKVKASNKGDPRRDAPQPNYGGWYSGRAGRP
jgi:hypothetical protein